MGRKKSYKKQEPKPRSAAPANTPEGAQDEDDENLPATAESDEDEPAATSPASESAGPAIVPQVITGRPEWAVVAPQRLEAAEEEGFWYVFSLAVVACAPNLLGAGAAVVAAVLAGRMLRALWSVPADVAPDDIGSARMMLFMVAILASGYKMTQNTLLAIGWMMTSIFFFNSLHNVRTMVGLALKGGKKKRREIENQTKS
jgi:hypothetical protein